MSAVKGVVNPRKPLFAAKIAGHHGLKTWLNEVKSDSGLNTPHFFHGAVEPFKCLMGYEGIRDRVFHRIHRGAYRYSLLNRSDFNKIQPNWTLPDWAEGCFFYPEDGWFDPQVLMESIEIFLRRSRVSFIEAEALKIIPNSLSGLTIETSQSILTAKEVLVAAGIFSDALLENSGVTMFRQTAVHGQTLFGRTGVSGSSVTIRGKHSLALHDGFFRFGSTSFKDPSLEPDKADLPPDENLARDLRFTASGLQTLEPQGVWGIRARLPDREPAVGEIPLTGTRRIWVSLGFYKNGLQLADLAAKNLLSCLSTQRATPLFNAFSPRRFFSR